MFDKNERSYYFFSMTKGKDTKQQILESGLDMASELGLDHVTIGGLAKATGMSKSGLFAHFASKENLQLAILQFAEEQFVGQVVRPALKVEAGIPRIRTLVDLWVQYGEALSGGCVFVTAATEYSDRPGPVQDALRDQQERWITSLQKVAESAIKAGDFRTDISTKQFAFDVYSLLLGFHYYDRLLGDSECRRWRGDALDTILLKYTLKGDPNE